MLTPTTKEEHHDRPISPKEIVEEGWMTQEDWDYCSKKAMELFSFGQKTALENGMILVDTKYEMGKDSNCLLYTSPSPRDRTRSRMPSSA